MNRFFFWSLLLCQLPLFAQSQNVVIHQLSDPDGLNPLISSSSISERIQGLVFSTLLDYDPQTLELRPILAKSRPKISKNDQGKMTLEYEIRPEAKWDNGQPVLASDFIFTIKAINNPLVNAAVIRPYYEFIEDVFVDPNNPKKFTILSRQAYFSAEESSGTFSVLPEYIYDPKGLMRKYSLTELHDKAESLSKDPNIEAFAKDFNDYSYASQPDKVVGCGPYRLQSWEKNAKITLALKADWWGKKIDLPQFQINPPVLTFVSVADPSLALQMLREEKIDVMAGIRPDNFEAMYGDPDFSEKFQLFKPEQLTYQYIGFNLRNPKLADKNVRKALALLVNREEMIQLLFKGDAVKINGPINPAKPYYNKNIPDLPFDPEKAKELLKASGWTDSDNNGILDKTINGKKEELSFVYHYNTGNYIRQEVGFLLQEEAEAIGIKIEIQALPWSDFLNQIQKRDFEIICLGWSQSPGLDDMKQIWHSSSAQGEGSNYAGFGNAQSDALIDELRSSIDENRRRELYHQIQALIAEEQPYVFLFSPRERLAIHKRFKNVKIGILRPGYQVVDFKP